MKSYSIEVELIDKTGKNVDKNVTCKINDFSAEQNKNGKYVWNSEEESVKKKKIYILFGEKKLILNLVEDPNDEKLDDKKTKLFILEGSEDFEIGRETIAKSIAWNISKKRPVVDIKVIYDKNDKTLVEAEENKKKNIDNPNVSEADNEKIEKIVEQAKKQGGMTYGELAMEIGNATPAQIEVLLE